MHDPLSHFKRWEGEDPNGDQVAPATKNLLHIAGAGGGPGDGFVAVRMLAAAMSSEKNGELRYHVLDAIVPAPTAAQMGLMLFEAAKASGFDPVPDEVEAEVIDGG